MMSSREKTGTRRLDETPVQSVSIYTPVDA